MSEHEHEHGGKSPSPFFPAWTVTIGPVTESGEGLLPSSVWNQSALIDSFLIHHPEVKIRILPKTGEIRHGSTTILRGSPKGRLIWFRRMQRQYAEFDVNTGAAECLWYGAGLQWTIAGRNVREWFKLLADGRIIPGGG